MEKQEEEPKTDEHGCKIGTEKWDAEQEKCVPIQQTTEEKAFMAKIMGVFDEAIEKKMATFWEEVNKKMEEAVKKVENQAILGLRKGLGISDDPVIHLSELPELVRKTVLEIQPHGKRTETPTPDKPTEGAETKGPIKPAEEIFNDLMKKKGAP